MTQERRRYGFVLERQCSIAKHWMAYHTTGKTVIDNHLENWQEIAASREILPTTVYDGNSLLVGNKRLVCSHTLLHTHTHTHIRWQYKVLKKNYFSFAGTS